MSDRPTVPDPGASSRLGGSSPPPSADPTVERLEQEAQEGRLLRLAIGVAVLLHGALFVVRLPPSPASTEVAPPARQVFVLRETRYRPPEPDRPKELPRRRERRVPIPDPTPDEPEPLPTEERAFVEIPMPGDVVVGVPDRAPEPVPDSGPVRWHPGIVRPVKLEGPEPQYTVPARRARIQGVVVLEAVIDADGRVRDVRVLKALPLGLSEEAVRAVEQWRYRPATLDGAPVAVLLSVTVRFGLT